MRYTRVLKDDRTDCEEVRMHYFCNSFIALSFLIIILFASNRLWEDPKMEKKSGKFATWMY